MLVSLLFWYMLLFSRCPGPSPYKKKNENGFGFLDFLPCQFLCAWAWGEHVVLELKLCFEGIIYLRKNRSRAIHLWKGIVVYFGQFILSYDRHWRFLCTMIRPPYSWIAAKSGAYISIECFFFFLLQVQDANLVHSQLPWRVSRLLLLV